MCTHEFPSDNYNIGRIILMILHSVWHLGLNFQVNRIKDSSFCSKRFSTKPLIRNVRTFQSNY